MTPTLFGRWQTRLLLLFTVGLFVSLPFAIGVLGSPASDVYFWILFYVAIFGLGWDVVYDQIQKYRWDRDWPAVYQLFAGIWEFIFIVCGVKFLGFLPTPIPKEELPLFWVFFHYFVVWLAVFLASQSLMRILFVRWRFFGGQWL
ncbi:hypothetical protein Riv7116_2629 [Rivularia sp. PCC 7116]|uniref:hypothetical protein n=1 Tax=Rivularia sp. PCC 7116 TaxID=373994 RepID=UPI00029ECFDA|nr:hypothetical protein [Rivularia sp. PCC 7116]AFY55135.1 hypothetical protein Riv7116_2629 [Rivularia sp. PCC 7116]